MEREYRCQICGEEDEDMRHVSVECFYDVSEVAPDAQKGVHFAEAEEGVSYWGITRRYPAGTRDQHRTEDGGLTEGGTPIVRIVTDQEPVAPIRLLEKTFYTMRCCKACRGEFLRLFGEWARGEHQAEPDPEGATIFVRENGSTRGISEEEWRRRHGDRVPARPASRCSPGG